MTTPVPCPCLEAAYPDPCCSHCRGSGQLRMRCDCGAAAEACTVEDHAPTCLECLIRWEAMTFPLSELLDGYRCGSPVRGMPGARSVEARGDDYYALLGRGWSVEPPKDGAHPRRIMLPPSPGHIADELRRAKGLAAHLRAEVEAGSVPEAIHRGPIDSTERRVIRLAFALIQEDGG